MDSIGGAGGSPESDWFVVDPDGNRHYPDEDGWVHDVPLGSTLISIGPGQGGGGGTSAGGGFRTFNRRPD